jgi:hexulose-6-phosphate isomerase
MNRRDFLAASGAAPLAAAAQAPASQFRKSICSGIFPREMPYADQIKAARNAGFEGIEFPLGFEINDDTPVDQVKRLGEEAQKAGVTIVSLWVSRALGENPLNSEDPEKRARGTEAIRKAVQTAGYVNCEALLLVPCRLGNGPKMLTTTPVAWERTTAELKKVVPAAEKAKVHLTPENVWNKFLVSPLDMRGFVDQFKSRYVAVHFDVGNIMQWGYPQDWILTLGPRIRRIHVKDYKLSTRAEQGRFVDLLEGDVDWKAVMEALVKVGYRGFLSPEVGGKPDDPNRLMNVSKALDKILSMA